VAPFECAGRTEIMSKILLALLPTRRTGEGGFDTAANEFS